MNSSHSPRCAIGYVHKVEQVHTCNTLTWNIRAFIQYVCYHRHSNYVTIECLWCYKHMYVHTATHTHPYTHTHTHTHTHTRYNGTLWNKYISVYRLDRFLCIDSEMVIHVQHLYIHPTHMYSRTSTFVQFLHVVPTVATALTESISVLS